MERLRLVQFSDLHLGVSLTGGKLALPPSKAERRRAEHRQCLTRLAKHVGEARPAAVLIPGDLFDTSEPDIDDLNFAINAVNSMPVPVFIAPGNHDGYSPSSCYNVQSALYQSRGGGPKWASHVRIFTANRFETVPLPSHSGVTVTGVAYHRHVPDSQRVLYDLPRPPQNGLRILLFHGSLQSYRRAGSDKEVLPFIASELERAGYTYAAVGHYHRGGPIATEHGRLLGAYAGAPCAITLADEGVGSWLDVELAPNEPPKESNLHWHPCDDRAIHRIDMDVTGLTDTAALDGRLDDILAARMATARDLVCLALRGRLARGVDFAPGPRLNERFFHAVADDSAVEPDYTIDFEADLPQEPGLAATCEEVFRWKMLALWREATSDEERARIKEALFYGLDALTLGEIHLR